MLKALELHGFKSFADKTRFDFPAGITVVVGPNGSGKSNIVDAIKWVLGEQSAKSLRGKEMADVIFKGASSDSRKAMNSAEATIIFDNSEGILPIDAPEVHVTRRVFRSGEGEYLINRHPCRLKDIRDLCRGTGIGTDAYSIIEQGKVDTLLQTTARDRRAVFEEAAGISRFKAKKVETQRRLERVDQNLVRLSDIVDEVESRYRAVKAQAGKAQRYREYTERLKLLRTVAAAQDWKALSGRLEEYQLQIQQLGEEQTSIAAAMEQTETSQREAEEKLNQLASEVAGKEARFSRLNQRLATVRSASKIEFRLLHDLSRNLSEERNNLARLQAIGRTVQAELAESEAALGRARNNHQAISNDLESVFETAESLKAELGNRRAELESQRSRHVELLRNASTLENQWGAAQSRIESQRQSLTTIEEEIARAQTAIAEYQRECERLLADEATMVEHVDLYGADVFQATEALKQRRAEYVDLRQVIDGLQRSRAVAKERASVLDELERIHEGLSSGVKEILSRSKVERLPLFRSVIGLVADILNVDVEIAKLIEIALGESAQLVLLESRDLLDQILEREIHFPGRVGFLVLNTIPSDSTTAETDFTGEPGVLGRAIDFVQVKPEFTAVGQFLLRDTWLVEDAETANRCAAEHPGRFRFVTSHGELLERDGRVFVGPTGNVSGIISRRSELRALRSQVESLDDKIAERELEMTAIQEQITTQDETLQQLVERQQTASVKLSEHRSARQRIEDRAAELTAELERKEKDRTDLVSQIEKEGDHADRVERELQETRGEIASLEKQSEQALTAIAELDSEQAQLRAQITGLRVELARAEQEVGSMTQQTERLQSDYREQSEGLNQSGSRLAESEQRYQRQQLSILNSGSEEALLQLQVDQSHAELAGNRAARRGLETQRNQATHQLVEARSEQRRLEEQRHRKELAYGDLRHERATLEKRLEEDYGLALSSLEIESPPEDMPTDRAAADQEIGDLRRKISNIGAVNMQALQELDDLQTRYETLSGQLQDLVGAKESLETIIQKINMDSRRLFEETLDTVRSNFQTLFRKVFGGGSADIVVEEGADILEGGIDVIATPPGKQPLNISLLSGGERALTAVTLLLAIFQFRPSPFCILDEVDGPLDEANIGRFVDVLDGFLDWTRFVIVSHSKATMAAATTLHGVTMQESGISKRVSVRFDEIPDEDEPESRSVA
ncbi:MAG: chromosome segregation protein SMC [Pirellulaceae bacterium]